MLRPWQVAGGVAVGAGVLLTGLLVPQLDPGRGPWVVTSHDPRGSGVLSCEDLPGVDVGVRTAHDRDLVARLVMEPDASWLEVEGARWCTVQRDGWGGGPVTVSRAHVVHRD